MPPPVANTTPYPSTNQTSDGATAASTTPAAASAGQCHQHRRAHAPEQPWREVGAHREEHRRNAEHGGEAGPPRLQQLLEWRDQHAECVDRAEWQAHHRGGGERRPGTRSNARLNCLDMRGSRRVDQRTREGAELKADAITATRHSADGVARSPPLSSAGVPVNPRGIRTSPGRSAANRSGATPRSTRAPRDRSTAARRPRW